MIYFAKIDSLVKISNTMKNMLNCMPFNINKVHFIVGFSSDDVCMPLAFYCDVLLIKSLGFCFFTAFNFHYN